MSETARTGGVSAPGPGRSTAPYRYAPDRDDPRWALGECRRVVATALWRGGSAAFALYANWFGSFNTPTAA